MIKINIFHPTTLVVISIFGYVFLPFTYYATIGSEYFPVKFYFFNEAIFIPFISHLMAVVFLLLLRDKIYDTTSSPTISKANIHLHNTNVLFVATILLSILAIFMFWFINYLYGFTSQSMIMENIIAYRLSIERDSAGILILRNTITTIMIFLISANWYFYKISSFIKFRFLFLSCLLILGYLSMLSGRRLDLVSLILMVTLFINFSSLFDRKKIIGVPIFSLIILVIFFFVVVSWYSFFRKGMDINEGSGFLFEFVRRFDGVYPNFEYLYTNNLIGHKFFYGITYVRAILNFIPRSIFPQKHDNLQMYFNDNLKIHDDSGMDFGNFGEIWVNFGPACVLFTSIYFLVLRRFIGVIYLYFINLRFSGVCLYCYLIYGLLHFISSPIDSTNIMFFFINLSLVFMFSLFITLKCIAYEVNNES